MNVTQEALSAVLDGVISRSNAELRQMDQAGLEAYWHFRWDDQASMEVNIYRFHTGLGLYASFCRRWEEHHNGSLCVVERVRDTYLMPKIRQFAEKLRTQTDA